MFPETKPSGILENFVHHSFETFIEIACKLLLGVREPNCFVSSRDTCSSNRKLPFIYQGNALFAFL